MSDLNLERQQDPAKEGKQVLKVSGGVTIRDAHGFHDALVAALEDTKELQVDLSGITGIDLTGLQLICSAHHSALREGKWLYVTDGGNMTLRDSALGAGFQRHTGCVRDNSFSCIWVGGES